MWSEKQEQQWQEMTKTREANKKEVGKLHTIKMLRKMADALEKGKDAPAEIEVEYLRHSPFIGQPGPGPIYGKKITLIYL